MRVAEEPYFLTNSNWYRFDEHECKYILTNDAPEKAVKSYNEYYDLVDEESTVK